MLVLPTIHLLYSFRSRESWDLGKASILFIVHFPKTLLYKNMFNVSYISACMYQE